MGCKDKKKDNPHPEPKPKVYRCKDCGKRVKALKMPKRCPECKKAPGKKKIVGEKWVSAGGRRFPLKVEVDKP